MLGALVLSTTGGDQQINFAYGLHPKYGSRYGASLIAPEGLFNAEFKDILDSFGRPKAPDAKESAKIDELAARGVQFATFPETVVPYYPYFSFVQRPSALASDVR